MTTPIASQDPRNNPMLRDVARVSPATFLCLVVGSDDEGWAVYRDYAVGVVMVTPSGKLWRVIGFTLDNLVICAPHGLGHDRAVVSAIFKHEMLGHGDEVEMLRHKDALI